MAARVEEERDEAAPDGMAQPNDSEAVPRGPADGGGMSLAAFGLKFPGLISVATVGPEEG